MQALMQQISPPPPAQPQQQQEQKPEEQPRDLLEALHGKKIKGREIEEKDKKDDKKEDDEKSSSKADKKDSSSKEDSEDDGDATQDKLSNLLATVQDKMSEYTKLAETNPEAFKRVIALVHKLVDVAKAKNVKKGEVETLADELNKAIKLRLPVGTVKGRRKKVVIDGKEVWRSMASGQVKDSKGEAVSVRSSNAQADAGDTGVKKV